jgi:dsDNA-specific endonuclease/ATPase MutS2
MKALGLAALMARTGLPLPAAGGPSSAQLPAFSSVLADIGDEQSLTANLSTFSGHLKRIQARCAEMRCPRCCAVRRAVWCCVPRCPLTLKG